MVELGLALDYPSKLDRSGPLIERLLQHGHERADWFFDRRSLWPRDEAASSALRPPAGTHARAS